MVVTGNDTLARSRSWPLRAREAGGKRVQPNESGVRATRVLGYGFEVAEAAQEAPWGRPRSSNELSNAERAAAVYSRGSWVARSIAYVAPGRVGRPQVTRGCAAASCCHWAGVKLALGDEVVEESLAAAETLVGRSCPAPFEDARQERLDVLTAMVSMSRLRSVADRRRSSWSSAPLDRVIVAGETLSASRRRRKMATFQPDRRRL
jgi:hypothetical protein